MTEKMALIEKMLDDMALKIMMVEPGDLSTVGELVTLVETLVEKAGADGMPVLQRLAGEFGEVVNRIVMTELDDSQDNFDLLGQNISVMQELCRKEDNDPESEKTFTANLSAMQAGNKSSEPPPTTAVTSTEPPDGPTVLSEPPDSLDFMEDMELLSGFIEETLEHLESIEVNVLELEDNPGDLEIINNIFRPFHTIKGVSGFLNLANVQTLAHSTENLLDDVRNNKRAMDSEVIEVVLKVGDCLKLMAENLRTAMDEGIEQYKNYDISAYVNWVKTIQGQEEADPEPVVTPATAVVSTATAAPASAPKATKPAAVPAAVSAPKPQPKVGTNPAAAPKKARVGATIKVDVDKLDGLVNAVGELVIMQTMVRENSLVASIADPKLNKDFGQLFRITTELQKTAMSMRMVPIRQTFQKMIRLVRDLSKKTGKQANLVMEGEETEIDRNMVDSIYDPLVHMMRNSVDHGVQMPDERERLGKPSFGTVSLRAYQKGGYMVIEIEDDGQGLNTQKIRRKAIERGIIQESDNISDQDLNNLVFMAGFSTADKITDVSGRGVGMDVVKKAVEKLRGKVDVVSEPGKGSIFTIRLPLTLAIIDGIIVRVGAERYIIPTIAIRESFRPTPDCYKTVRGKGEALMVRGNLVPVVRLYQFFNVKPSSRDICEAIVVVVDSEGKQRAIMVDELLGKQEVVIKNLGGLSDIDGVAGGTILGDGRVGLILDLAGLVMAHTICDVDDAGLIESTGNQQSSAGTDKQQPATAIAG